MPLVYQQNINAVTKIGVWHITEPEDFFLRQVTLQREITHWHKRLQHLAGRLLLKELYPDFPLELILVADTKKPYLPDEPFHFSISHCGDYAAVVVSSKYRVGVDIEQVNQKIERIIPKFLTDKECTLLPAGQLAETATLYWSVKETVFKWNSSAGVDFKKQICIRSISGDAVEGLVHCVFDDATELDIHYLHFNDNYLSWLLTLA
jgi:4'-phosphopantetheinyl transferase EntD